MTPKASNVGILGYSSSVPPRIQAEMHVVGALKPHVAKMRDTVVAQKVSFFATRPGKDKAGAAQS